MAGWSRASARRCSKAEAGAIGAPAAVMNAVASALAPLGVGHIDMPATAERVWRVLNAQNMPQAAE